ncbi:MAG: AraC family transcriptional regulator [Cyanobacteria bacterium P01_D01_bin.14]
MRVARSRHPEYAHLWTADIPGVELFQAHLVRHRFGKHFHESYTIGFNDGGQGYCDYRGERLLNHRGNFNLLNPGEVHPGAADAPEGWWFRNLYLSIPLVEQSLAQINQSCRGLPSLKIPTARDAQLEQAFNQLFQALAQPTHRLAQQSCLLALIARLFDAGETVPRRGNETGAIATVCTYLETHYAEDTSIEDLANRVGLSPFYLIRSFRQQMGLPPHSYQRQIRLLRAKRALATDQPLSEIALATGFYDQSHLNRVFKQAFATTPGQYRQRCRQGSSVQDA